MRKSVYLAGKMDGLTPEEAMNWRKEATGMLMDVVDVNSPDYDYCADHPHLMWGKDYFLIDHSDILLVNFDYEKDSPFLGTSMEIGRCFYQRKPIIIFSNKDWVHDSITFKYHATAIVRTMNEAIDIIRGLI